VEKGAALEGYTNYYNVPEGVEPALFVKQYESVTLKGLWPGIDLRCYSTDGTLETDWLVAAGADYSQIRFEVKGAELSTDAEGHLIMSTPFGEIREGGLKVFQEGRQLEARWVISPLEGEVPGGVVSFEVIGHDPMLAMRIDPPIIAWGTYYGGSAWDDSFSCSTDLSGNVYMVGYSNSLSGIATTGSFQTTTGSQLDAAFLVKFNSIGQRLWGTYYGGGGDVRGKGCVSDNFGNVYVAGVTTASIGIINAHQPSYGGGNADAFLAKFNSNGIRLWATHYGGNDLDEAFGCDVDAENNVYLVGYTLSTNNIATAGGHQVTFGGGPSDAFAVRFNPDGVRQWGTYIGGTGRDEGRACSVGPDGSVYIVGYTQSQNGIGTQNSHQAIFGGYSDAFVVKLNSSGNRDWGTYYGGNEQDYGWSCATGENGIIYLCGRTESTSGIATNGVHQSSYAGGIDSFLAKFDSNGNRIWGTYHGGDDWDEFWDCTVDNDGNIILAGRTESLSGIATLNAPSTQYSGGDNDGIVVKLNSSGFLEWGTYLGGGLADQVASCATDASNNIYLTGYTQSVYGISEVNAHQPDFGGGSFDAFLVKFNQALINGIVWLDLNMDCIKDDNELGRVEGIALIIQPGDYIVQTDMGGNWSIDSLPVGNYTISIDTTNLNWLLSCPSFQSFSVIDIDLPTIAPPFGMTSAYPCPAPDASIVMPTISRGFSHTVYVHVCNNITGTEVITNAFTDVVLDPNLSLQSASLPYSDIGDGLYRFFHDDLYPGQCIDFTLNAIVELSALGGQTLCVSAELFPQPVCVFDTVANQFIPPVSSCDSPWSGSDLAVLVYCDGDSVHFTVSNIGSDMDCYSPVRVYMNEQQVEVDSLLLNGGDSALFTFLGNAQTWRLEVGQHPNFPGNSNPTASIENCGLGTWTPGIISEFPQDDADPIVDIFCGQVSAPQDPNDKTGFPLGLGETHAIQQNQEIEYLIRFQNVGTAEAVNVVILDTLTLDFNIFTVQSGVSSHPYEFRMYGTRVLEWRFNNIMLPDSTTDNPGSNGFVLFKVQQVPNLPFGTVIENTANIYFDFEEPVITNTYFHTVTDFDFQLIVGTDQMNSDQKLPSFYVFPNPGNSIFNLVMKNASGEVRISVTDNMGREVLMESFSATGNSARTIDMSGRAIGIYFLRVQTENGAGVVKLVKE
jgi:uncharacterized repeat protein (TIGR01451 family)